MGLLNKMSDSELAKYGIDKDYAAKMRAISKGGGGGGAAQDNSPIFMGSQG
jgi:hypothetical protein